MNAYNAHVSTIWKMCTKEYYISKKEKCTYFNDLENVHKRFLYFQERKMHMCQEFGKLDLQERKMLTTIATDGAGVIFVT